MKQIINILSTEIPTEHSAIPVWQIAGTIVALLIVGAVILSRQYKTSK